jgi:flagellar basal body-associated protein FliL
MKLIPKYAQIKFPVNNEAAKKTLSQTRTLRIKNEINLLYKKKQNLNTTLPHPYTQCKHMATNIKFPINNEAAKKTLSQTHTLRIKNVIKFLYKKKQNLSTQLYHIHIHNANIWQQTWNNSEQSIN